MHAILLRIYLIAFFIILHALAMPLVVEIEEDIGTTAILNCESNDVHHNFMFWQMAHPFQGIVGPGNNFNTHKYNYEVLSGKLIIHSVSIAEDGYYNCVSKGVRNNDINIRTVRMIVKKDWEDVYEHDTNINLLRIIVVVGSLIILIGGSFLLYTNWKRPHTLANYLEQTEEEDSAEEIYSNEPSTSKHNIIMDPNFSDSFNDNQALLSTDFRSISSYTNK